jgi:hypothetical protein
MNFADRARKRLGNFSINKTGRNKKGNLRLTLVNPEGRVKPFNYSLKDITQLFEGLGIEPDLRNENQLVGRTVAVAYHQGPDGNYIVDNLTPVRTSSRMPGDGRPYTRFRTTC